MDGIPWIETKPRLELQGDGRSRLAGTSVSWQIDDRTDIELI
jgi:hypothetical protein